MLQRKSYCSCTHFMATNNLVGRLVCSVCSRAATAVDMLHMCRSVRASHTSTSSSSGSSAYKITIRSMRMNMNSYISIRSLELYMRLCDVRWYAMRCMCWCKTAHAKVHTDPSCTHFALMQSSQSQTSSDIYAKMPRLDQTLLQQPLK